ncbi:MAG: hypothetical protein Q7U88_14615 [Desulfocapsaceae bacterium]|nr:hypothetical protein [Desulfocapsaceae bacterium]
MIHVAAQPEPSLFDTEVRQKGLAWLQKKKIALDQPLPPNTTIEPYWRHCLDEMHSSYNGCCAYLAVFVERVTGGGSVDHFVAKSQRADLAYEWSNYRLACSRMNSRKRDYDDVLDPFEVGVGWFHLEPITGRIYPNPELSSEQRGAVQATIDRLGLDDPGNREMRARHYQEYREGFFNADFLRKRSPFVWDEAQRQGLL